MRLFVSMSGRFAAFFPVSILSILLVLAACQNPEKDTADKSSITYKVVGIRDGDTFNLLINGKSKGIRLGDIDCPEKGQPFGKAAKQLASELCFGKEVKLVTQNKSAGWGRIVGWIYVNDTICVNKELVKAGLAWQYDKYSDNEEYAQLENEAREKKVGLWADANPIPPWDWRKKD